MNIELRVRYSDEVVRSGARRFFLRHLLQDGLIPILLFIFAVVMWITFSPSWYALVTAFTVALILGLRCVYKGMKYVKGSLSNVRSLKDRTVLWQFSEEFFGMKSSEGTVELRWKVLASIRRYPEV